MEQQQNYEQTASVRYMANYRFDLSKNQKNGSMLTVNLTDTCIEPLLTERKFFVVDFIHHFSMTTK